MVEAVWTGIALSLLLAVAALAWRRGGRPERVTAAALLLITMVVFVTTSRMPMRTEPWVLLVADVLFASVLLGVWVFSQRFWSGIATLVQSAALAWHAANVDGPLVSMQTYGQVNAVIGLTVVATLVFGIVSRPQAADTQR